MPIAQKGYRGIPPFEVLTGEVLRVIRCYCLRWMIELFFRVLKQGCRVESRRFESLDRVTRFLAVALIVAWRTLYVTRLGRDERLPSPGLRGDRSIAGTGAGNWVTNCSQLSEFIRRRSSNGANSAGMLPRLSRRTCRPVQSKSER